MEDKNNNIWKIVSIISIVIVVILLIYIIATNVNSSKTKNTEKNPTTSDEEIFKDIRINEDFSTDGTIEGIENVRWSNANIMQFDNKMEISIMLNNESATEKIDEKELTVILIDKDGNEIAKNKVKMEEIPENYGYTTIDLELEQIDLTIIYDIKIIAE